MTKLLEQEGPNATNRNRFRIMANLGSAHAAKGDKAVAVDWYRQAYEEYPETAEGLSILAAAEAIDDNHEEAVNIAHRALALPNPQDRAVAALLECAPADIPWKQLQSQIPQQFQNKPEFLLILAERAQIAGANKDYHQLIKEAVRRDPQNWRVLSYAGYLRFREVMAQNQSLALGVLRGQDIELLTAAQSHFVAAWGSLKDSGYQSEAETTLMNAISVSLLLRDEAALNDLIQVASGRFGGATQLLRVRATVHIQRGEPGIAADIFAKIPTTDRTPDDELMHLQTLINDGRSAEALAQADKLYRDATNDELRIAYGHCRMMAAAQVDTGNFAQIAQGLLSAHPSSTLLMSSYILSSPDNLDDQGIMDRLAEAVGQESNIFARDLAARALAKGDRDSIAADILLGLCSPESDTPQLHLALKTLVNSRRIREARELYGKLSPSVRESASLRRIGAVIRQCDGDMKGARRELEALLGSDDETLKDRAHWIDLCERLSDIVAIKRYLESVSIDLTGEPRGRMYMARKIDYYSDDHQKALEIGYRALRDGYDDPEIHASYMIGLIMTGRSGRDANFERSQVAEDTVIVFARDQGDPVTRIIETAPTPRIEPRRVCRRLQLLSRMEHHEQDDEQVFP